MIREMIRVRAVASSDREFCPLGNFAFMCICRYMHLHREVYVCVTWPFCYRRVEFRFKWNRSRPEIRPTYFFLKIWINLEPREAWEIDRITGHVKRFQAHRTSISSLFPQCFFSTSTFSLRTSEYFISCQKA